MAEGKDHVATVELLAAFQHHPGKLAVIHQQVADALLEAHFAAEGLDLLAHGGDHAGQAEGADMRLADCLLYTSRCV